jgi:membrane protein YdbS with pleckstrin-like domain
MTMSDTRRTYPLSPRKILKKTLTGSLFLILLAAFLIAFIGPWGQLLSDGSLPAMINMRVIIALLLIACCIVILANYLYQRWYFAVYFYDLTTDYIIIRKGPIVPREINIPYERIQDVYVDQDILDRLFGLYDVHLSSATVSSGTQAHIDGLEKPAADALRALLLDTVTKRIGKK